jgi:hypothetical protein
MPTAATLWERPDRPALGRITPDRDDPTGFTVRFRTGWTYCRPSTGGRVTRTVDWVVARMVYGGPDKVYQRGRVEMAATADGLTIRRADGPPAVVAAWRGSEVAAVGARSEVVEESDGEGNRTTRVVHRLVIRVVGGPDWSCAGGRTRRSGSGLPPACGPYCGCPGWRGDAGGEGCRRRTVSRVVKVASCRPSRGRTGRGS